MTEGFLPSYSPARLPGTGTLRGMQALGVLFTRAIATWRRLRTDFSEFLQLETAGSVFLLGATALALLVANTSAFGAYERVLNASISIDVGAWHFGLPLIAWIDDAVMALFFFVVGLEIKRELVVGELSRPRKAALPIVAALGGMIAPAAIYWLLNRGTAGSHGWGIPMATDIAFALGALALLGSRAPGGLRLFLVALAIADDLGAIVVIAVFYTKTLSLGWLAAAAVVLVVMFVMNRLRVDRPLPYAVLGTVVWFAVLNSGVHSTIAGVLVALTIPVVARLHPTEFTRLARERLDEIEALEIPGAHVLDSDRQQDFAFEIREAATHSAAPLQRIEHFLHPITTFVVLPLFAFANAGVRLVNYDLATLVVQPVTLGVLLGLLIGKPVGITLMTWVAVKTGLADLPGGVGWRHVLGAGMLGGIGFTMSLFVSNLAFRQMELLAEAKLAVLATSVIAGMAGYVFLSRLRPEGPGKMDEGSEDGAVPDNGTPQQEMGGARSGA
jgi:NhaA family Na+:H+ antiporter